MPNCYYESSKGEIVQLNGPTTWIGTGEGLRGNAWAYSLGSRNATGITREAYKVSLTAWFKDEAESNRLNTVADYDMYYKTPGTIHYGDWFQRAFISGADASCITKGSHSETLEVLLLDGQWGKWNNITLWPTQDDPDVEYLDLPTDVPFDLMPPSGANSITNNSSIPSPMRFIFYGPAVNPYILVGKNRYELNLTIPTGAYVIVDGSTWPRTITMVSALGDTVDAFSSGTRGNGEGSGSYIFEPIQPGHQKIQWSGSFGVDVDWLTLKGALPWGL